MYCRTTCLATPQQPSGGAPTGSSCCPISRAPWRPRLTGTRAGADGPHAPAHTRARRPGADGRRLFRGASQPGGVRCRRRSDESAPSAGRWVAERSLETDRGRRDGDPGVDDQAARRGRAGGRPSSQASAQARPPRSRKASRPRSSSTASTSQIRGTSSCTRSVSNRTSRSTSPSCRTSRLVVAYEDHGCLQRVSKQSSERPTAGRCRSPGLARTFISL